MHEKIWALHVNLGPSYQLGYRGRIDIDNEVWDIILSEGAQAGLNTIVLEIDDALILSSHPEIAADGAWTRAKLRKELKKCRDLGLRPIPLFNFSAAHDRWMGIYSRMLSTPEYYRFCNDVIKEVFQLFDHPEYIHLAMDEESPKYCYKHPLNHFRKDTFYWHDLRFLVDCVADTGAKPWIWSSPLFDHPEDFRKHFAPEELVISPYHYNAIRKEHYTPITSRPEYLKYYAAEEYAKLNIRYVEEDPFLVRFMEIAIPLMQEGYSYIPCASVNNRCVHNHNDLVEYFRDNAPDAQILGYMTAPWYVPIKEYLPYFRETFQYIRQAKETFYG